MREITVKDVGPVSSVTIPVPDEGGVVVLRGRNGCGKSRTLDAVNSLVTGKGKVDVKDGSLHGLVEAFGVTMKVGRSTRRTGELEVQSLEGKLSVAEFVDPGIKDPAAADAKRVKALVALTGVEPKPEMFYDIVGGRANLEKLVQPDSLQVDDLVVMSDKIKRDLEAAARSAEKEHSKLSGTLIALQSQLQDIPSGESDPAKLQDALTKAIQLESKLTDRKQSAAEASQRVADAKRKLHEIGEVSDTLEQCLRDRDALLATVRQLEDKLLESKSKLKDATYRFEMANHRAAKVAELHKELDQTVLITSPTDDEISSAIASVTSAREALESGTLIRKAKEVQQRIKQTQAEAERYLERSQALREAAKATDNVLDQQVSKLCPLLKVDDGRLVLETKRGQTYFAELSDGERWRIGLNIAIDLVGEHGLITLPQGAWEGLDDLSRGEIAEHVKSRGAIMLTAECGTEDQMTGILYGDNYEH